MPFSAGGVYTPPAGATSAAAGDIIRSATWNSIHSDLSTAINILSWGTRRTVNTGSFSVNVGDAFVIITASAPVVTLPLASTKTCPVLIVGGAAGIFSGANSVVTPTAPDTISGLATVTLTTDFQIIELIPMSSGGYIFR